MKIISVLIAAYKAEEFICDAIESALNQKIPSNYCLEIIVGVDGCEETWDFISGFQSPLLTFVKMKDNYGTYITFNTLSIYARGSLIARFDADDVMLENYLLEQINIFEENTDVSMTRTWSIYTDLNKTPIVKQLPDGTQTSEKGERQKGSDGQFMMRREVWNILGAFKPWRCFADTDFLIRAQYLNLRLFEIEKFLYLRRVHENSLTQSKTTGYYSELRQGYKAGLLKDTENYKLNKDCHVKLVVGEVEGIHPLQ